jgi:hypothetical protein
VQVRCRRPDPLHHPSGPTLFRDRQIEWKAYSASLILYATRYGVADAVSRAQRNSAIMAASTQLLP